jgi:hypothetical protein
MLTSLPELLFDFVPVLAPIDRDPTHLTPRERERLAAARAAKGGPLDLEEVEAVLEEVRTRRRGDLIPSPQSLCP